MDSVIMDGRELRCGSVACVQNIKNPVSLARAVMEKVSCSKRNFHSEKEKIMTYKIVAPYSTKVKVVFDKKTKVCMPIQHMTDARPIAIGQLTVTWVTK